VFGVKHICLRVTSCVSEVKHSSLMFSTVIISLQQESEVKYLKYNSMGVTRDSQQEFRV
jgi:hypothetical protein